VTFEGTREFQDLWLARLNDVMCGETSQPRRPEDESSTCRVNQPRSGWWLKGFGDFGNQGSSGAFPGYDSRIFGGTVGFDAPLESDEALGSETRVGVGVGYSRSYIDGKQFFANAHSDTYEATAYVDHEQGPWFVQGDVSFGWNEYSGTRNIVFPGVNLTANSGYSGQSYTTFATTGYHFYPAGGYTITPLASLQFTHMTLDGYTETGAGDVDLRVNSQSYDFVESGLGVKAARPFATADGTYVPEVHFKWLHELANPALQNTAAFAPTGSATFTTPGLRTSDETYDLGGGLTFLSCSCSAETWSLEAVYDYHWRTDNYSAHQGMIRLSARF
jgi:outer membrane autotransporter protein